MVCENAAIRLSKAVLRCAPVLVVAFFLPAPYGITLPPDFISFLAFCVTMAIGLFVVIAFGMLVYIATFYTLNSLGVRVIAISLADIFTGALVPLPFLPDGVRAVFELTPFAAMQNIRCAFTAATSAGGAFVEYRAPAVLGCGFDFTRKTMDETSGEKKSSYRGIRMRLYFKYFSIHLKVRCSIKRRFF